MNLIYQGKERIVELIKQTEFGNKKFYQLKQLLGKNPNPDILFPELISIETSSICNLSCSHCPPQLKEFKEQTRKHSHIDFDIFNKLMDEIDNFGIRNIALHKDGEPLLHPKIISILERLKKTLPHVVYLTTNGQFLSSEIIDAIIKNRVDVINFSIGASSEEFYKKVRGKGFPKTIQNIHNFLDAVSNSSLKPRIFVQIIDLPEFPEMKTEIKAFKKYWKKFNVEVAVWKKLTWNVFDEKKKLSYRYPCYSLWHSFNINSNGLVTACCMDWKQELIIGNVNEKSVQEIWTNKKLSDLRCKHLNGEEQSIDACRNCNYWNWQPMLINYP